MTKGKYREIKGDLLEMAKIGECFDIIAHGCNCHQMMGAGIALGVKKVFPMAHLIDHKDKREPIQRLGDLTYVHNIGSDVFVVNLYTQFYGGANLDYSALELSLRKLTMEFPAPRRIGLPMIGCGIAGGDWNKVKRIIKRVLSEYDVTIVIYDK